MAAENQKAQTKAGPLEALLLAIEFGRRVAEAIPENNEDGPVMYVLPAREWLGILECADFVSTPILKPKKDEATRYVVEIEAG